MSAINTKNLNNDDDDEILTLEILTENEIRAKYRADVEMVRRNRPDDCDEIRYFLSCKFTSEDDAVNKCLFRSATDRQRAKESIQKIIDEMKDNN